MLWDRLTFGPARRRRRMLRRLRELDRQGAMGPSGAAARRRGLDGERLRWGFVMLVTTAVMVGVVGYTAPGLLPDRVAEALGLRTTPLGHPPAVQGSGSYTFLRHQRGDPTTPVAYSPCREIRVVLNPDGGPDGSEAMLRRVLQRTGEATGLRFVFSGRSSARPRWGAQRRPLGLGRSAPVLVTFASPEEVPELAGRVAGIGGSVVVSGDFGRAHYVTGQVTLDSGAVRSILQRPDGAQQVEAIMLHEFGHLVGLGHVADPHELMYAQNTGQLDYGTGDRLGLAELGRGHC